MSDEVWTVYGPPGAVNAKIIRGVPFPGEDYRTICKPDGTCERVPFKDPNNGKPTVAIVVSMDATHDRHVALVCRPTLTTIVGDWFWETDNCGAACHT